MGTCQIGSMKKGSDPTMWSCDQVYRQTSLWKVMWPEYGSADHL